MTEQEEAARLVRAFYQGVVGIHDPSIMSVEPEDTYCWRIVVAMGRGQQTVVLIQGDRMINDGISKVMAEYRTRGRFKAWYAPKVRPEQKGYLYRLEDGQTFAA